MHQLNQKISNLFLKQNNEDLLKNSIYITDSIEYNIRQKINARFDSPQSYNLFLRFCCDIGRLDIVAYALHHLDASSPILQKFIELLPNIQRIKNFSKIPEVNQLQRILLTSKYEEFAYINNIDHILLTYFNKLVSSPSPTATENMILNFMLYTAIECKRAILSSNLCIRIIDYYKNTHTEQIRREAVYLLIYQYAQEQNIQTLFQLPNKNLLGYINNILYALTSSSLLTATCKAYVTKDFIYKVNQYSNLRPSDSPKFAICMSGIYRNHLEALDSIKQNLIDPLQADLFIHSWDTMTYWSGYGGTPRWGRVFSDAAPPNFTKKYHFLSMLETILPNVTNVLQKPVMAPLDKEILIQKLNPTSILIENESEFISSFTRIDGFTRAKNSLNQIKMFYGIKKSIDLALQHCHYDFIIRIRPDVLVEPIMIEIESLKFNNTIYCNIWHDMGLDDLAFIISDTMAYDFSKFVDLMLEKQELSPFDQYPLLDGHSLLASWVYSNNYNVQTGIKAHVLANSTVSLEGLSVAIEKDKALLIQQSLTEEDQATLHSFLQYLEKYCS